MTGLRHFQDSSEKWKCDKSVRRVPKWTLVKHVPSLNVFLSRPIHHCMSYKNNNTRRRPVADGLIMIGTRLCAVTTDKNCVMSCGPLGVVRSGLCWLVFATLYHVSYAVQNSLNVSCKAAKGTTGPQRTEYVSSGLHSKQTKCILCTDIRT